MPILANVTEAIGNTPLVRINRIIDAHSNSRVGGTSLASHG